MSQQPRAVHGDAAAASDPSFGAGLSLTLLDVRLLRDSLLDQSDWTAAAEAYAARHDVHFASLHRMIGWMQQVMYGTGPDGEALRAHILPLLAEDPSRRPDLQGLGPFAPTDEVARQRYFGEDRPRREARSPG